MTTNFSVAMDRLERIARLLGRPLDAFLTDSPEGSRLDQLLNLWARLPGEADQSAALDTLRALAEERAKVRTGVPTSTTAG